MELALKWTNPRAVGATFHKGKRNLFVMQSADLKKYVPGPAHYNFQDMNEAHIHKRITRKRY